MEIDNINFFIGYDSKEDLAYRVCKNSLLKRSTINIKVNSLKIDELIVKKSDYYLFAGIVIVNDGFGEFVNLIL